MQAFAFAEDAGGPACAGSLRAQAEPRTRWPFARALLARTDGAVFLTSSVKFIGASAFARFALARVDLREGGPLFVTSRACVAFTAACCLERLQSLLLSFLVAVRLGWPLRWALALNSSAFVVIPLPGARRVPRPLAPGPGFRVAPVGAA
jgi:hypothetical protein